MVEYKFTQGGVFSKAPAKGCLNLVDQVGECPCLCPSDCIHTSPENEDGVAHLSFCGGAYIKRRADQLCN